MLANSNSVSVHQNGTNATFPQSWKCPVEQSPRVCPAAGPGSGPSWSFSSDRNSPKSTNLPSVLSVHSSNSSAKTNQSLATPCASEQGAEGLPCARGGAREGAALRLSLQSCPSSWDQPAGARTGKQPLGSTALRAQSTAPAGNSPGTNDPDLDLELLDIGDFDEDWESPGAAPAPARPVTEGPPAKSLLSKIMSRAKGSVGSTPAAPKPALLMATKNHPGELYS